MLTFTKTKDKQSVPKVEKKPSNLYAEKTRDKEMAIRELVKIIRQTFRLFMSTQRPRQQQP